MGCLEALRNYCEFTSECPLYREDSYTCNHGGGVYCGKYRWFKEKTK